jgi:hypothetical protein
VRAKVGIVIKTQQRKQRTSLRCLHFGICEIRTGKTAAGENTATLSFVLIALMPTG